MPSPAFTSRMSVPGALLIAAPALVWTSAPAEEIELKGGDRLTGTIVERNDDRIVLDHDALGRLEIALARVVSIDEGGSGELVSRSCNARADDVWRL